MALNPGALSPRSPERGSRPSWVASFAEATRTQQLVEALDRPDLSVYGYGNNKSEDFFRKMEASFAETERYRQACRLAASQTAATARKQDAPAALVKMCVADSAAAKAVASFARDAVRLGDGRRVAAKGAPIGLGHLVIPEPTKVDSWPLSREVLLPGAIEPFEDASAGAAQAPEAVLEEAAGHSQGSPSRAQSKGLAQRASVNEEETGQDEEELDRFGESPGLGEEDRRLPFSAGVRPAQTLRLTTGGREAGCSASVRDEEEEDDDDDDDDDDNESEESNHWPPKRPALPFKMLMMFSSTFRPSMKKEDAILHEANRDLADTFTDTRAELQDPHIPWINRVLRTDLRTEYQLETTFPLLLLLLLDAIYQRRVRWTQVDWRYQYKRSQVKNHALLQKLWFEVNMDKAKDFRNEYTQLRIECLLEFTVKEKLEFLRRMKRWFDSRMASVVGFDPISRRRDIAAECLRFGHQVDFPPWIRTDRERQAAPA